MTNLLKAYKGENRIIYPLRENVDDDDDDDDEDSNKWENLLSNVNEEGIFTLYFKITI